MTGFVWRSCAQWAHSGVCPREPESFPGLCRPSGKPDRPKGQSPEVCSGGTCGRHTANGRILSHMQPCKGDLGKATIKVSLPPLEFAAFLVLRIFFGTPGVCPHVLAETPFLKVAGLRVVPVRGASRPGLLILPLTQVLGSSFLCNLITHGASALPTQGRTLSWRRGW